MAKREMLNYKFEDVETGEIFFVQQYSLEEAIEDAKKWFKEPVFLREIYEDEEAEMLGYDTY